MEVMIAVLILSMSLASLFAAQTGTVGATQYIKHVAVASQLARCRMSELELEVLREGFELAEFGDWNEGPCCELRDDETNISGPDPFSCRWKIEMVTLPSVAETQTEATEAAMGGDTEAMAGGAMMSMLGGLLPIVQQLLEQAIRRVTVQVVWNDGRAERNVEVVQYLSNPSQGSLGGMMRQGQQQDALEEASGGTLESPLTSGASKQGSSSSQRGGR